MITPHDLMDQRAFGDAKLRRVLDEMTYTELVMAIGEHDAEVVRYAEAPAGRQSDGSRRPDWRVGDGRPAYADDDPAVMAAIGRCASARVRWADIDAPISWHHPGACGWCEAPVEELLRACAWAIWASRLVTASLHVWKGAHSSTYVRPSGLTGYQAPAYRDFDALSAFDQSRRVTAAIEASRS